MNGICVIIFMIYNIVTLHGNCSNEYYLQCLKIAEPLLKEADHIFPDNQPHIEMVCKEWNQLIFCLSQYTEKCFSNSEKADFHKAVSSAIDTVYLMCTNPDYQKEYLSHAMCIKPLIMENEYCGNHYNQLVSQVSLDYNLISYNSLCCSYWEFKTCLSQKTDSICRKLNDNDNVTVFVNKIIDKSLNFLQEQCRNTTDTFSCSDGSLTAPSIDKKDFVKSEDLLGSHSTVSYEGGVTPSDSVDRSRVETYGRQLWQQTDVAELSTEKERNIDRVEGEQFSRQQWFYNTERDENNSQTKWATMSTTGVSSTDGDKWYPLLKKDEQIEQNEINNQEELKFSETESDTNGVVGLFKISGTICLFTYLLNTLTY